jgi:hypothetical protein
MVSASNALLIVFKRTGGRAWLKPWGFKGLEQTQKRNRRKDRHRLVCNADTLRIAEKAHWDRLDAEGALPHWGESKERVRQRKLRAHRKWELWLGVQEKLFPPLKAMHESILEEARRQ